MSSTNNIYIYDYTAKSFVVRGDTQPHKDSIKAMGGKFDTRFTDKETGEKFGGWLFWTSKRSELANWIQDGCPTVTKEDKPNVPTTWEEIGVAGRVRAPQDDNTSEMREMLIEVVNIIQELSPESIKKLSNTAFYKKHCKPVVAEESDVEYEEETDTLPPPPRRRLLGKR